MQEKLKRFLTKENHSDEELELFLFAMNQQQARAFGMIRNIMDHIEDQVKAVNIWIMPRLQSKEQLSEGLRVEMRIAMRTLQNLCIDLENASDFLKMKSEAAYKNYREADGVGHFNWQEKVASDVTLASEE